MFYHQVFIKNIGTKVVTVNGITYTAWDTLNVTDMNAMFLINNNLMVNSHQYSNWNTSSY
jgi:hypothetical protein